MFNIILIIVGFLFVLFMAALIHSSCVVSGKCNKTMAQYESDILCDKDDEKLTGLENQTLEKLLQLYEEDGVNFVINDGKVVNYEVE